MKARKDHKDRRFEVRTVLVNNPVFEPCPRCVHVDTGENFVKVDADNLCPVCGGAGYVAREEPLHDPTNPKHYSEGMPDGVEVRDILKAQGLWEAFCHANVIKYSLRANYKNGLEDLKKLN